MDSLTFIGIVAAFVAGTAFGTCLMYFGGLIIEWQVDKAFEQKEEDDEEEDDEEEDDE